MNFLTPTEEDFLEGFSVVPERRPDADEMVYAYRFQDSQGMSFRLSFDVVAGSVQTTLAIDGREISTVSMEGAVSMRITGKVLRATFEFAGARAELSAVVEPSIAVTWWTLVG